MNLVDAVVLTGPLLLLSACDLGLKAAEDVPREIREARRVREVRAWAGQYTFSECEPPAGACYSYVVAVDDDAGGSLRADGSGLAVHVKTKPHVKDEALRLVFDAYLDGGPGPSLFQLGPINKRGFDKGEHLATLTRDASGRSCLVFAALASPRKTSAICR